MNYSLVSTFLHKSETSSGYAMAYVPGYPMPARIPGFWAVNTHVVSQVV